MLSSVQNVARILHSFRVDCPELSLTELSRSLQIPKSTMFKLLYTLQAEGFLERNEETGNYRPGRQLWTLARTMLSHSVLAKEALPFLRRLAKETGMSAHLSYFEHGEAVWIEKVNARSEIPLYSRPGRHVPAYAPASGRAILAYLPQTLWGPLLAREWVRLTPHTLTDKDRFLAELSRVRRVGYALQREEVDLGIASIGVPLFGTGKTPIASISIAGPAAVFTEENASRLGGLLKEVASGVAEYATV
ncbi:IclR family transcriptional regulator [Alicyclobacillus herbarius]|uniref:IclR family transcriptional regulator n=1 Tax=Alicyclobacillus herbarius TaxID=122960 RepID=UPI0004254489|nr:IclR family transcriptional regulator [Alicyclobacillus herbarius]